MVSHTLISIVLLGEGLLTGLMLTLMLGPVTMVILRNGIHVNRQAGIWTAIGTWVSDFVFIAFTYSLTASVKLWANDVKNHLWIYVIGGTGLILMGLLMVRIKKHIVVEPSEITEGQYVKSFIAGFFINSLSPFTLFFWLGIAIFLRMQPSNPVYYYTGLMITLGIGDLTKAWLAPKLADWLKAKYVYWIQVIAGACIAITGGYIVYLGVCGG